MDNIELMEMIKKAQKMIDNNEVPEEIKVMARNMQNSNNADASKINLNQQNKQQVFNLITANKISNKSLMITINLNNKVLVTIIKIDNKTLMTITIIIVILILIML